MEKIRGGLISLFYLFLILTLFGAAASATTVVKIMPQSETVNQGDTVSVNVQVIPDRALRGAQVELTYDTNLLIDAISDGGMFNNFGTDASQNEIFGYQMPSQTAVSGQDNLAQIQFTASSTNVGTTSIDLSNVKLKDENGDVVPASDVEVIDGTITVVDPTGGAGGSTTTTIEVMPQSKSVCQDQNFAVEILVTPGEALRGAQVELTYDTNLLADAISDGGMFSNFGTDASQNEIFGYQMPGQAAVSGQGNLAQVQFTASSTNVGTTSIDLSNVKLKDENGDVIPVSNVIVTDGSVTVTACTGPPTPQPEITAPADGATVEGTVAITVEEHSGSDNISYNLLEYYRDTNDDCVANDGNTWNEIVNDTADAPWGTSWTPTGNGKYILRTRTVDETNGLVSTDEICVTVNNPIPDNSIPLNPLWNYISFPGTLDNATPEHVLDGLSIDAVLHYNAQTGIWENAATFGDFEPRTAYAIRTSEQGEQTIVNLDYKIATPPALQLYEGWNSVGLVGNAPGAQMNNGEDAFAQIDGSYDMLVGPWNATGAYNEQNGFNANVYDGTPPQGGINKDSALYMLKRYEGHWINMTSADMLT